MCGILVLIDPKNAYYEQEFYDLNLLHKHRGEDASGCLKADNVYLGSMRLSVHDLGNIANQPFTDRTGRFTLVFNGAIYNFKEIKSELKELGYIFKTNSDTEVLLYSYIEWNIESLSRFNGMFSVVIYDRKHKNLFIARDALGVKPLHYSFVNGCLIISSEIRPILNSKGFSVKVNKASLTDFFLYQSPAPDQTFFEGVKIFPSGHYTYIDCSKELSLDFNPYWDISSRKNSKNLTTEEFKIELIDAVRQGWQVDRKIGLQLSGGVDSSLIAALMSEELGIQKFNTYSAIFDNRKRKYSIPKSEETYIDIVTSKYNINSYKFPSETSKIKSALEKAIIASESPLHGASTAVYYLLAQQVKPHSDVLLTGEGVDDIFNGYHYNWNPSENLNSYLPSFCNRGVVRDLLGHNYYDARMDEAKILEKKCKSSDYSPSEILSAITTKYGLPNLLARHDRMFMSSTIEGRPIFADKRFFDLRMRMSESQIHKQMHGKRIFKEILSGYFDPSFVFRKKIGFSSPYGDWLSDNTLWGEYWRSVNVEILSDYFDPDVIQKFQNYADNEQKWSGANLNLIMCLTNFQVWHDNFIIKN